MYAEPSKLHQEYEFIIQGFAASPFIKEREYQETSISILQLDAKAWLDKQTCESHTNAQW